MLVLNFMYMKKNLFRFSSRRFLFSTVMAFALVTGAPQAVFANVGEVQAVSQTGVIKGKIVDSYGEPVIGANVKVKGTTNGTITDMDGNFTLNNVSGGTLVISFIGYKTLEVSVKGTNLAKIIMHEDTEVLDEVVVDVPDKLITLIMVFFILKGLPNKLTTLYEVNSEIETLD